MTEIGTQTPDGSHSAGTAPRPVRIFQFSDLHLYADPDGRLLGQNTRQTFESVVRLAQSHAWPPDALVLTGDLIHDQQAEGYRYLRCRLEQLGVPFFCLPGNHDRVDLLAGYTDSGAISGFRVEPIGIWDLALLDSTIPFNEGGHLETMVLADLDQYALVHPRRNLLIFLHHHPEPVGSRWIDSMQVDNGSDLMYLVAAHPNIFGVVCGHVHQAHEAHLGERNWMSTPSTCIQFLPYSESFALDQLTPGYRWFELYPDGRIKTAVRRTHTYPDPLLPSVGGY